MNFPELLWTIAYCTFLLGSAWSFRTDGAPGAVWMMAAGALLDAAVAFLPQLGVESMSYGLERTNQLYFLSLGAGTVVYALFLAGLWFRHKGRRNRFHWCIALAQPVWFLSFIGFLYALYIVPDAMLR